MTIAYVVRSYDAKANLTASVAPTANDDETEGYIAGSIWVDTVANKVYICSDSTTAAANWIDVSSGGPPSGAAGGDLGGSYPNPTVVDLTVPSEAQGDLLIRGATGWQRLPAGTDGQHLRTQGAGVNPIWEDLTNVFGQNYVYQESTSRVVTTSDAYQDKVTLTTGVFTGVLRIGMSCIVDSGNKPIRVRVYNVTDTTVLWEAIVQPSATTLRYDMSAMLNINLTGSSKQIKLQWANIPTKADSVYISEARLETWRVS